MPLLRLALDLPGDCKLNSIKGLSDLLFSFGSLKEPQINPAIISIAIASISSPIVKPLSLVVMFDFVDLDI